MQRFARAAVAAGAAAALANIRLAAAQADGNPHNWDRLRRCDQTDYSPACGVCEGIGGRPFGDKNEQIILTTCKPSTQAEPSEPKRPIFGTTFNVKEYYEILIGKKNDPFCFQTFPGNDSTGPLCYRPQQGSQIYDMKDAQALRYDVEVKTVVGNLTSTVLHKGENMWIVNHFPWYELGLKQCICTEPRQGGDYSTPKVYPIQFNWTDNLRYIGREELGIEFIWRTETVDHWAFGPHHVWTYPSTGQILRMWQPFNGLEVFPDGLNPAPIDATKFADVPPQVCTKHAPLGTIRVKCTDEGYPQPKPAAGAADVKDLKRARTKVPAAHFRGDGFAHMSSVLNKWLEKDGAAIKPCEQWTAKELQRLQAQLYLLRNEHFDGIYQDGRDNRRLRHAMEELEGLWSKHSLLALEHGLEDMHRDGHCHEAVMWYVHHLDEQSKEALRAARVEIPLLSSSRHSCPEMATNGQVEVCRHYEEKVTCASCHSNVVPGQAPMQVVI